VTRLAICGVLLAVTSGCAIGRFWEPSRQQLLERMVPSAVQIVLERDGQRYRSGSGVVIAMHPSAAGPDCFVLTSGHTLSRRSTPDKVYVLFGRDHGPGTKVPATVVAHHDNKELDLSLLRARTKDCFPVQFGRPPELGGPIWVLAYPWGRHMTLVAGIVSQVNVDRAGDRETAPRFIVDASVSYGSSGGGVYDGQTGRLVGIVEGYRTARVSFQVEAAQQHIDMPVPGETYVVPLADIRRFLLQADRKDLLGPLPLPAATQQ
jgi:serine protease Do